MVSKVEGGQATVSGFRDWMGVRRGSMLDWAIAATVAVFLASAVRFFWARFPHPVETGPLLLGLSAMLAAGVAFGGRRKDQPFGRQALMFAAIAATSQAVIQLASTQLTF